MTTALRTEWIKVRRLPLPRYLLLTVIIAAVGSAVAALGADGQSPDGIPERAGLGLLVAGIFGTAAFAVWMFAVEVSQGTLSRAFCVEPRRSRVILAKAVLATVLPIVVVAVLGLVTLPITVAAVNSHGGDSTMADFAPNIPAAVVQIALVAPACFGLGLITGSMTGGIVASLLMIEILPGILAVSGLADASLIIALSSLATQISDGQAPVLTGSQIAVSPLIALLVLAAWSGAMLALGLARVRSTDIV